MAWDAVISRLNRGRSLMAVARFQLLSGLWHVGLSLGQLTAGRPVFLGGGAPKAESTRRGEDIASLFVT